MTDDRKASPDHFYLVENRKHEPKESFKFTGDIVRTFVEQLDAPKIADVGCATGEFLYYMNSQFPGASYFGFDISPELVARAREEAPFAEVAQLDITDADALPAGRFDLVFMNGVNGAFEDPMQWLPNLTAMLAPGGRCYVYGIFNPSDLDVIVRVKKSGDDSGDFLSYWNNISKKTIARIAKELGYEATFHPFEIGIDLPPSDVNPFRSWTVKLADGRRQLVNGTQVVHNFFLLELTPAS